MPVFRLAARELRGELMDDPGLDPAQHMQALRGLARLNRISHGAGWIWRCIAPLARQLDATQLSVLDIATGGGDMPIALWHRARRSGLNLRVRAADISPRAVAFAAEQAERSGAEIRFEVGDALADPIPEDQDIIVCSLFLHHLADSQAFELLARMAASARHLVIVNDLVRSPLNLLLVRLGARLVTRSPVVHSDGPRSVKAAFRVDEALRLASRAGLDGARLQRCFPCRFLLTWRRGT